MFFIIFFINISGSLEHLDFLTVKKSSRNFTTNERIGIEVESGLIFVRKLLGNYYSS